MIVGINRDGSVAGVRVLSHKETPGLGDKVELKKSQWILSFNGRSLDNPLTDGWAVRKDKGEFDQFTGATITPRAVIAKVHGALTFFSRHKRDLFPDSYLTERVPLASSMLPDFTSPDNVRTESEEVTPNG
jgi:electron transport complex protein RnfG